jgi:4'-phosphopantetheinyl transferase
VLASYVDVAPGALAFRVSELGRPELEPPQRALSFNLTNKPELVACAVSRAGVVGVDVEPLAAADTILDVASTVFTARELLDLGALDLAARRARALRLWTAKEAYMKARGMGMTLPPRSFEVAVRAVGEGADRARTELVAVAPPHADGRRWAFEALELDGHLATVCVEASAPVEVRTRRVQLRTQPDAG